MASLQMLFLQISSQRLLRRWSSLLFSSSLLSISLPPSASSLATSIASYRHHCVATLVLLSRTGPSCREILGLCCCESCSILQRSSNLNRPERHGAHLPAARVKTRNQCIIPASPGDSTESRRISCSYCKSAPRTSSSTDFLASDMAPLELALACSHRYSPVP